MRKLSRLPVALVASGALILSACGADDEAADFQACLITDTGGIDDRSFNQTAWEGLTRAESELGIDAQYLLSSSEADYEPNIQTFMDQGCDVIVTVGFALGDATEKFAIANPDQIFGIVDYFYENTYPNLQSMSFDTDQAAFLAGYVAASVTETGVVGTWGGIAFPTVTVFMDGFVAGVNYHNAQKGTTVEVIGWDGASGVFTGSFDAADMGNAATMDMLQNGADVIMPVAGPAGLGAGTAIQDFASGLLIWVDTDGYFKTDFGSFTLTSVEKKMDPATFNLVKSVLEGNFEPGNYIGTLADEGVEISPFHDLDDRVSDEVKAELDVIRSGIIAGDISTRP